MSTDAAAPAVRPPPSGSGKDLADLVHSSRATDMAFLDKAALPAAPRNKAGPPSAPRPVFHALGRLLAGDWWGWLVHYARFRFGRRHPFLSYAAVGDDGDGDGNGDRGVYPLGPGPVRVALASDWATGTDEAFRIGQLIEACDPHWTVHLGDVYFVGDPAEVRENFLGIADPRHSYTPCTWPPGSRGSFALNGNHEMYARGKGYFSLMLPVLGVAGPDGPAGQKASFFCLENEHWRIVALDTGYNSVGLPLLEKLNPPDCALRPELVDWLRRTVFPPGRADDRRGIVVLSHHQYYSAWDDSFPRPAAQLAEFIDRPVLWFWGHEHRMAVYGPHRLGTGIVAHGRCIGHGGMPVDLPPPEPNHAETPAEFVDDRLYGNDEHLSVGVNGFAGLTFEGARLRIDYVDVHAAVVFTELWAVGADGMLERLSAGPPAPLSLRDRPSPGIG